MAIGYACLTIGVPGTELSTCSLKYASVERLHQLITNNLSALEVMINYNSRNGIRLFRISSDIIPFGSHPANQLHWWKEYEEKLAGIGKKLIQAGIRVSMHPGQYTVINSPNPEVVERSVTDLIYHARFLDSLGVDSSCKIILHIGGVYSERMEAMNRFLYQYKKLPDEVKKRLVIENDEKSYNISEVLSLSELSGAPVVFDNLHHSLNSPKEDLEAVQWIKRCTNTWTLQDGLQKIHYSQQKADAPPGSHSETIGITEFQDFYQSLPEQKPDIMLEVKDKNLSALKCINTVTHPMKAVNLETEWSRYKYFVLSKSANIYQAIRELLKEKREPVAMDFYRMLEQATSLPEDKGAQINAAEHVWGYFSKESTAAEKNRYQRLLQTYKKDQSQVEPLKRFLLKLSKERNQEYLLWSLYFYL